MKTFSLLALLPQEVIPVLVMIGGFLLIFGLRGLAMSLFTLCGIMIIAPVILDPILAMLPDWALYLIMIIFWVSLAGMILSFLIGENARDHMVGGLAGDVIKWLIFTPFRLVRGILRLFMR